MYRADQDRIDFDRNLSINKSIAQLISRKYIFNDSMSAPLQVRRLGGQGSGQERRSREQSSAIIPLGMLLPFCVRFARNSQRCTHPPAQPPASSDGNARAARPWWAPRHGRPCLGAGGAGEDCSRPGSSMRRPWLGLTKTTICCTASTLSHPVPVMLA